MRYLKPTPHNLRGSVQNQNTENLFRNQTEMLYLYEVSSFLLGSVSSWFILISNLFQVKKN